MSDEYHELVNVEKVDNLDALELPRARALVEAVRRQSDFLVIKLLRHVGGSNKLESVIVDIECDGVPPKNLQGINYRERLALCVPEDPGQRRAVLCPETPEISEIQRLYSKKLGVQTGQKITVPDKR